MGLFDRRKKRPEAPPQPTEAVKAVSIYTAPPSTVGQSSLDIYAAPAFSVSGQPQNWSWKPKAIPNAKDNTWQANWNAMPPLYRPFYGMALQGGVSKQLLREIYETLEGHTPNEGANLVNVMHENGVYCRIENGELVYLTKNSNGTMNRAVLVTLLWPNAETSVIRL
jgi:hypothetical protein